MGLVNRIINIAILVLALASVFFSYLLFSKREKLVDGWKQMAQAINGAARNLDANSDTKSAAILDPAKLGHKTYDDMVKALPELDKQSKAIAAQRDALAEGMKDLASSLEIPADAKELSSVKTFAAKKEELTAKAAKVQQRDNGLIAEVVSSAKKINVNIDPSELKDVDTFKAPLNKFNTQVENIKKRIDSYGSHIAKVSGVIGASTPDLKSDSYQKSLDAAINDFQNYKNTFEQTKRQLADERSKLKTAQGDISAKDSELSKLKSEIEDKEKKIEDLKKIAGLGGETGSNVQIVRSGDIEALKMIKGKVIDIDPKWGFVVVDVGSKNKVKQTVGKLVNEIEAPLPVDKDMVVARTSNDKEEYVGKIKIVKVYDNCAIANVLSSAKGSEVQVGDMVFFNDEDLKAEAPKAPAAKEEKAE